MSVELDYREYLKIVSELILCLAIILGFIYFGLHSEHFHRIIAGIGPFSVYLLPLPFVISGLVAYCSWTGNDEFISKFMVVSEPGRRRLLFL